MTAADLIQVPAGPRTYAGLRHNIRVGVRYLETWMRGVGCVPIDHLMEDAATAEICRTQVWQWLHHAAVLDGLGALTPERFGAVLDEEMDRLTRDSGGAGTRFPEARALFERLSRAAVCEDFLTLPAYEGLIRDEHSAPGEEAP